jgi:CDP-diacylglycerol--glycerol-3-phosphate 3-phosphatidyltransferase
MVSKRIQQWVRQLVTRLITPFARVGITPNMLTGVGLLLSIVAAVGIAQGWLVAGGLLVLLAGLFDMFDGAMARVQNASTSFGAFLDSTLDRYSESIILLGLLVYALQRPPDFQETLWPTSHEQTWMILLIFLALTGSFFVSYTRARAEGLGVECSVGILARPERVIILALGLLSGTSIWMLALLAGLSHVTAIERMVAVRNAMHMPSQSALPASRTTHAGERRCRHTYDAPATQEECREHSTSGDTSGTTTYTQV